MDEGVAVVSTSSPILPLSRYALAIQTALTSLGSSPNFDFLQELQFHLEDEYGGLHRDQI